MSDKQIRLEISQKSYDDLVDIQQYTFEKHGEIQWQKYALLLDKNLQMILQNPEIGQVRGDIPPNYLAWPVEEHIFVYRRDESIIYLVRVLHKRMDFRLQF